MERKISLYETKEALLRSGYLLEHRIEEFLRRKAYYVEANEAYPDPETAKSRELDIYAIGAQKAGPEERDFIFPVLLVECVNNPQPRAFLTKSPIVPFLHSEDIRVAGLPAKIRGEGANPSWEALPSYLAMDKYHHYCRGRVATQFCSFVEKRKQQNVTEWMATHEDSHFDSFRKLAAAVNHFSTEHFESWRFGGREFVNVEFFYPVLVVQGDLLDVRHGTKALRVNPTNHIQYRMTMITSERKQKIYQIDVVTERQFPKLLKLIEEEVAKSARLLRRRHVAVRKAIDEIVKKARRFRSPAKIRAAMEP